MLRIHKGYALLLILEILVYRNVFLFQNAKLTQQLKTVQIVLGLWLFVGLLEIQVGILDKLVNLTFGLDKMHVCDATFQMKIKFV